MKPAKKRAVKRVTKAAPKRKRNPAETAEDVAAAEQYRLFHGRPPRKVIEYVTEENDTVSLAECGRLVELIVRLDDEWEVPIAPQGHVQVATTADGGQIYFLGGKQELDLAALGAEGQLPKDLVEIGECTGITYHTTKGFHEFEPTDYVHEFGDEGGRPPRLNYSTLHKRIYLSGGTYQVKPEGIVD